jgi:O-antigen/teichoic acid export membrane protein
MTASSDRPESDPSEPPASRGGGRATQAGLLVLGTTLSTVSSLLVTLLVVRLLGKAEVGTLLALLMVYDTVALVLTSGFPQTLMYYLPARSGPERRAVAVRISLTLATLGAGAGALLALAGLVGNSVLSVIGSHDTVDLSPLILFAPLPILDLPSRLLPNLLVAEGRARTVTVVSVFKSIASAAGVLVPVALGYGVWTVAVCYVAVGLVHGLVLPWVLHSLYSKEARIPCPVGRKELFKFSIPLGATDIVSLLNSYFDRYLILLVFPAVGFAAYQAGAWQIPIITYVPYAVGIAYAPKLVELFKAGKNREALGIWQDSVGKVALIVLPVTVAFMVGAEELMTLLFTKKYIDAAPVFRCYASLGLLRVAAYGTVIVSAGRPRYVLQASLLSAGTNVALSIPALIAFGFVGPALGTAIAFFPTVAFYCWCIGRATKIPFGEVFPLGRYLKVLGVVLVAAVPAILFKLYVSAPAGAAFAAEAGILLGVFALLGTVLRLIEREDWSFVWGWLRLKILKS